MRPINYVAQLKFLMELLRETKSIVYAKEAKILVAKILKQQETTKIIVDRRAIT